jgi:hypothetical protein
VGVLKCPISICSYTKLEHTSLPGGGRIKAWGNRKIGQHLFVRDDVVEGVAPSLTLEMIEI